MSTSTGEQPFSALQLFGAPPVLRSEDPRAYEEVRRRFTEALKPCDFVEDMLVADLAVFSWEMRRWQRHKIWVLESGTDGEETALQWNIRYFQQLDALLQAATLRRDDALMQLERYREGLGQSARQTSDDVLNVEPRGPEPAPKQIAAPVEAANDISATSHGQ